MRSARPKRQARLGIIVFCEGESTEPTYIREFVRASRNPLVSVQISPKTGVPMTLVRAAVEERRKRRKGGIDSFALRDEYWVVFDCDAHPNVRSAFDVAKGSEIKVVYSNTCFEIWPLLHFQDHDAPIDRAVLQKKLSTIIKGYDPKSGKIASFDEMREHYQDARRRALDMRRRRIAENSPLGNPYTNVDELMDKILSNGKV
jgi:hypothetical protein